MVQEVQCGNDGMGWYLGQYFMLCTSWVAGADGGLQSSLAIRPGAISRVAG